MDTDGKTWLTQHGKERLAERTKLTEAEALALMDGRRYAALGISFAQKKRFCLVYSQADDDFFVLVQDYLNRGIVTVLLLDYWQNYITEPMPASVLKTARDLALYGEEGLQFDHRVRRADPQFFFRIIVHFQHNYSDILTGKRVSSWLRLPSRPEPLTLLLEDEAFLNLLEVFLERERINPESLQKIYLQIQSEPYLLAEFKQ